MAEPLQDFVVVELTIAVQGPAAGLYLRDMGARVVKVEPPLGDPSRYSRGRDNETPVTNMGPQYVAVNRGKESLCLDLTTADGRDAMALLLGKADVFLTNYRSRALANLGLDFDTLHAKHPNLIYASVNGFGPKGEDADKAMLDGAALARGGLAWATGNADQNPVVPGAIIADHSGAMQLALGVVTALLARERGAGGQHVQTSALGTQLWLQQWEIAHTSITGANIRRDGSHHPIIKGPYGIYKTSDDGAILIAQTMEQEAWDALCIFAQVPELAFDPRLQTPGQRLGEGLTHEDSEEIRERLRWAFAQKTAMEWDDFLRTQPEVIWERLRNWQEVLQDPQSIINDYFTDVEVPEVGTRRVVGNLIHMSETPGSTKGNPPMLGSANEIMLAEMGFSAEQIAAMEQHNEATREEAFAALLAAQDAD